MTLTTEAEVVAMEKRIADRGYYPIRLQPRGSRRLGRPTRASSTRASRPRSSHGVERWMAIADEKLRGSEIRCIVSPANDDMFEIDQIIERASSCDPRRGRADRPRGLTMISTGWTNPTPWNTFRELPEDQLRAKIDELVKAAPTRIGRSSTSTSRPTARTSTTPRSSTPR